MPTRRDVLYHIGAAGVTAAALQSNLAQADMAPNKTAPNFVVPVGSCDCHVHVFDPAKFPYAEKRIYTPPSGMLEELEALHKSLHFDRVVVVQPSVYAADNTATLDAIRHMGPARARGVAVIDRSTSANAIDEMHAAGVRGVRLNLNTNVAGKFDAAGAKALLDATARQLEGRGWHVQFYTGLDNIAGLKGHLTQLPFPVVFDHFGRARAETGVGQPHFDALLDLVKSGHVYVKISAAYRCSKKAPDYADVAPLAQALVSANPDRIVWGSDWPHPDSDAGRGKPLSEIAQPFTIDDGLMLNQLAKWVPDEATRKKILVDNPSRLYGFGTKAS
jgi:predicted TIM-barrel fold metal-dependent hydrolase